LNNTEKTLKVVGFRGKIRQLRKKWINKVLGFQVTVKDGLEPVYTTIYSVFVPKLSPKYQKPHIIFHMANGGGTSFMRFGSPDQVVSFCQDIIEKMTSERWRNAWFEVEDHAQKILMGDLQLDEEFLDITQWEKEIINGPVDWQLLYAKDTEEKS